MKLAMILLALLFAPAAFCLAGDEEPTIPEDTEIVTTQSGLKYSILKKGQDGPHPTLADMVTVHYTGWLTDGKVFDSSVKRGEPASFKLGGVVLGWREGIQLMTPGSKFKFTIPPELGYGAQGAGRGAIPPNATLIFEVELISIKRGPPLPVFHKGNPENQKKTESGLVYEVIKAGAGERPMEDEQIEIKIAVWNEEGKLVRCSELDGRNLIFSTNTARIGVLSEGPLLLQEGSRYRFIVPAELAFGTRGAGPLDPPGAATIWEMELVKIWVPLPVPEFSLSPEEKKVTTKSGLQYEIIKEGTGKSPKMGQTVRVHYAGWLESGKIFDNSFERGLPSSFRLGAVVVGWNEGLQLMKEGAVYKFTIPGKLGYGERGQPQAGIPANATLIFHVELVEVVE